MAEELVLDESNMYLYGKQYNFPEGDALLFRTELEIYPTELDKWHTVLDSDELYKLAYKYYKDKVENASRWWWIIAIANDMGIDEPPLDISAWVGKNILIPDIYRIKLLL